MISVVNALSSSLFPEKTLASSIVLAIHLINCLLHTYHTIVYNNKSQNIRINPHFDHQFQMNIYHIDPTYPESRLNQTQSVAFYCQ